MVRTVVSMTATVSPGANPDYLLGQVASGGENYYLKAIEVQGEPAGIWMGDGTGDLGLSGEVDPKIMKEMYSHCIDPRKVDELHTVTEERWDAYKAKHPELQFGTPEYGLAKAKVQAEVRAEYRVGQKIRDYSKSTERKIAEAHEKLGPDATPEQMRAEELKIRRTADQGRTYYDVTFSAPKSWSLLHAGLQTAAIEARESGDVQLADHFTWQAEQVWASWMEGVQAGLEHLQEQAGYAREGRFAGEKGEEATGRRVDAHGFTAAAFRQHTSRDEDPQLHVHTAIWNRVAYTSTDPVTGEKRTKWGAIDGKLIYREAKAAGHVSERVAEEAAVRRLGIRFGTRPDGVAREVLGITEQLRDQFSSRRRTVMEGVAELAKAYEEKYGVAPRSHQLAKMAQDVTTDPKLRPKKKDAPAREELLARWEEAAIAGTREALSGVPEAVAQAAREAGTERMEFDPAQVVRDAVAVVQSEKSAFTRSNLTVEIARHLPDCLGGLEAHQVRTLINELTEAGLTGDESQLVRLTAPELIPVPPSLQLENGTSIYRLPESEQYATEHQLDMEERLLASTLVVGAPALGQEAIEQALEGRGLNARQEAALRGILGSGRAAEVLVGPAGSGKSRLNGAIHDAWIASGREVIGLTTSERAARVLADEGVSNVGNLMMFINSNRALAQGRSNEALEQFRIRPGQLIVVDEAGMSETWQLAEVRRIAEAAGAKILFSGDHYQLTSVGAGGMFQELVERLPEQVFQLDEVMRFSAEWERDASLRLREGDAEVLLAYEDRGRLLEGTREEMTAAAYQGWLADTTAGIDSLLITATQEEADQLSALARADLVRMGQVEPGGVVLDKRGIVIGVGDSIQLRDVDRDLLSHSGDRFAVNRDVVKVVGRDERTGELTVRYDDGELMTLPRTYVDRHVDLAYAGTVHAAQGRTVGRCRVLQVGVGTRESLYVSLTRGANGNWAYTITEVDKASLEIGQEAPSGMSILTQTLENSGAEKAASAVLRESLEQSVKLTGWSFIVDDLQREHAETVYGRVILDVLGEEKYNEFRDAEAYGPLIRLARHAAAEGHDAEALLTKALTGSLVDAKDEVATVHWRLEGQIEAAERAQVRADEADVRQHVQAQEQAVPQVLAAAQVAPVVPDQVLPELVMTYDAEAGGWVQGEAEPWEATPASDVPVLTGAWNAETGEWDLQQVDGPELETAPAQVMTWDYTTRTWVQQVTDDQVEPEAWVIAPPQPRGADDLREGVELELFDARTRTWNGAGAVEAEPWNSAAVEAAWLEQSMALNTGLGVLHSGQEEQRRFDLAEQHQAEAEERARWQTRVAPIEGEKGEFALAAAELMDQRRLQMGQDLADAEVKPAWAEKLGPVPTSPEWRERWIERAGSVLAYREAHGHKSETDPIGARPARGAVDFRQDWDRAFRALGEPEERMELVGASDAQLKEMVERYEREEAWAPPHVAPQLRETHVLAEELHREDGQLTIELFSADEEKRAELEAKQAETAERQAQLAADLAKLEEVHGAREAWHEHTEDTRERAQQAKKQLELRKDVEAEEELQAPELAEPEAEMDWGMDEPEAELDWQMDEPEPEMEQPGQGEFQQQPQEFQQQGGPTVPGQDPGRAQARSEAERQQTEALVTGQSQQQPQEFHRQAEAAGPEQQDPARAYPRSEEERQQTQELATGQPQQQAAAELEPAVAQAPGAEQAEPQQQAAQQRGHQRLEGEALDQAVDVARDARGILDSRTVKMDDQVAEARAAIKEIEQARAVTEAAAMPRMEQGYGISI